MMLIEMILGEIARNGDFLLKVAQLVFQQELGREDAMVRALHPEDLDVLLKGKGF